MTDTRLSSFLLRHKVENKSKKAILLAKYH